MKVNSVPTRVFGVLLMVAIGGGILFLPVKEKRETKRIREMLLAVQESLQNFHVREEIYPRRLMSGSELVAFLDEAGFLEDPISNPWTGKAYRDSSEPDFLRYRTDNIAETYELIVYEPDLETVRFRLDSTENQSLE